MDGSQETLEASQENRSSTVADAAGANIIDDALEYDLEEQVPWWGYDHHISPQWWDDVGGTAICNDSNDKGKVVYIYI